MSTIAKWYLCVPAITSVIGTWIGAIPIPLDWDKPWQQWPISCICGAIIGFAVGNLFILFFAPLAPEAPAKKTQKGKIKTN